MSPHAAFHSRILLIYAALTLGVLAFAGSALALRQRWRDVSGVWITYRSWLVMVPLIGIVVFLGRWAFIPGITLLAIFGFKEFARATGVYRDWWMTGGVYLALAGAGAACMVNNPDTHRPGWFGLFVAMPVYAILFLLIIPVLRNRTHGQLQVTALCIVGFIYGWMLLHLAFLANTSNPYGYVLFVLLATELNDVVAFTVGRLFGRHPLRSNISPNKTWEGALGAVTFSIALAYALWFSFPAFSAGEVALTGLIVGIGGQLGDLTISVVKRDIGVKDLGAVIPGHGGLLDRIDSLIFVAPLFLHMVKFFNGL